MYLITTLRGHPAIDATNLTAKMNPKKKANIAAKNDDDTGATGITVES